MGRITWDLYVLHLMQVGFEACGGIQQELSSKLSKNCKQRRVSWTGSQLELGLFPSISERYTKEYVCVNSFQVNRTSTQLAGVTVSSESFETLFRLARTRRRLQVSRACLWSIDLTKQCCRCVWGVDSMLEVSKSQLTPSNGFERLRTFFPLSFEAVRSEHGL